MSVTPNKSGPGSPANLPPSRQRFGRGLLAAVLIASSGLVAGCANFGQDSTATGSIPDDYRTRHPIVVSESEISEDIVVSTQARTLSPRDQALTIDFARRFKRSGASSVALMIPSGSRNEAAARRIAYQIAGVLKEEGVTEKRIFIQHYQAAGYDESATVRMVYSDLKAELSSNCGQWTEDIAETGENRNYGNFGCATQNNLAAMIANPADLLGPRGETEIDSTRRTNVITDWQDGGTEDLPALFDN